MGLSSHPARGSCGCFDGGNVLRAACNSRVHPRYFPDVSIGIREAAAEHEAMILHRVGVGDAAVRTGRVGKTVDLFLADRKSTRLNSSHSCASRMPSSA